MSDQFKTLEKPQMAKLESLEKELGCCLVALDPRRLPSISGNELKKLQAAEKEMGAVLLAYECSK